MGKKKSFTKPRVEGLENRWCPTATVTITNGSTLTIRGDDANNAVAILQNDTNNTITVVADGVTHTFGSSQVSQIDVDLKGGDDDFWYGVPVNTSFTRAKDALVVLGDGSDEAWLEFRGGDIGGQARIKANLGVVVDAGTGDDEVVANFNGKEGGALSLTALMGDGADYAHVGLWADVTAGANVRLDLEGGRGNDSMYAFCSYDNFAKTYRSIDVSRTSTVTLVMDGGDDNDLVSAVFSGDIDGRLNLDLHGGAGNDSMRAEVTLAPTTTGTLDAKVRGESGADLMTFALTDLSGTWVYPPGGGRPVWVKQAKIASALLDGGTGLDTRGSDTTANVTVINCEPPVHVPPVGGGVLTRK